MLIFAQSAKSLKGYLSQCGVKEQFLMMFMRMILGFVLHRGRMSCSSAAGSICSEAVHRGEVTRFLSRAGGEELTSTSHLFPRSWRRSQNAECSCS